MVWLGMRTHKELKINGTPGSGSRGPVGVPESIPDVPSRGIPLQPQACSLSVKLMLVSYSVLREAGDAFVVSGPFSFERCNSSLLFDKKGVCECGYLMDRGTELGHRVGERERVM